MSFEVYIAQVRPELIFALHVYNCGFPLPVDGVSVRQPARDARLSESFPTNPRGEDNFLTGVP